MVAKQTRKSGIFKKGGFALFTLFVWELVEEAFESLIAYALSSAIAIFVTKALSTLAIISATQGIKILIKNFLYPHIKKLVHKIKGNFIMAKIKQFFSWVWANKKTLCGIGSGAVMTLSGTGVIDVAGLPALLVGGFNITPLIYYAVLLVIALVGVTGKGFETIKGFAERVAQLNANKEQHKIDKLAAKELKAEQKLANQTEVQKEKSEVKAQAEKELRAKIDAAKIKLKEENK